MNSNTHQRRTCIITGANSGIGKETAEALVSQDFRVILACRDMQKCQTAAEEIQGKTKKGEIHCMQLDLSSLQSVRNFARQFEERNYPLHVLVNNAGIFKPPLMRTVEGHESQLGANHLGHFLLTNLLLDNLTRNAPSRIINVSSRAHLRGTIDFEDIDSHKSYSPEKGYSQSKLANVLFTDLQRMKSIMLRSIHFTREL